MIPLNSTSIGLKVKANAKKTQLLSFDADKNEVVIAVNAPADKGKANDEICSFFTKYFQKDVRIIVGKTSSKKILKIG